MYVWDKKVFGSGIVARTRQHLNDSLQRAYTPGLGFDKSVVDRMGGYYFDNRIHFSEDAEFDYRRRKAGIEINHLKHGRVFHEPVLLWHDLRAAYRIGYGKAQQTQFTDREADEDPLPFLKRFYHGEQLALIREWMRELGIACTLFNLFWSYCYYTGYYEQRLFHTKNA